MITQHRRPARRRAVENDAAANVAIRDFHTAAAAWWGGNDENLVQWIEDKCTDLERIAHEPDGSSGPIAFVELIAGMLWPDPTRRPAAEDLARTMARIGQHAKDAQELIQCEMHGWIEPFRWGQCTECICQVPNYDDTRERGGRPRLYCSDSCRQAAYRRRKRQTQSGGG
ncbi:hypothetical protein [Nocardia farcinica]|uniref:hypothetical protein n=1 Tax=Nocardia farcinica TaxID=37329 RepID=UPI0034DADD4B